VIAGRSSTKPGITSRPDAQVLAERAPTSASMAEDRAYPGAVDKIGKLIAGGKMIRSLEEVQVRSKSRTRQGQRRQQNAMPTPACDRAKFWKETDSLFFSNSAGGHTAAPSVLGWRR